MKTPSSPYINRFLQPDSIIPDLSNPQSWNRYSYVTNRPVFATDPTGHMMETDMKGDGKCDGNPSCELMREKNRVRGQLNRRACENMPSIMCPAKNDPSSNLPPDYTLRSQYGARQTSVNPSYPPSLPVTMAPPAPLPHLKINVDVDWSHVDKIDAGIDGIGFGADLVTIVSLAFGNLPVAAGAQVVGKIDSVVGLGKAGYDLITDHDATGLLNQQAVESAEVARTLWRGESVLPVVSIIGNGINLYRDLQPKITIQWVTP